MEGEEHETPVYDRDVLVPGNRVTGPAIVREQTATTVVEPGWQAELTAKSHLVLTRVVPLERTFAVGTECDPVMLEVFNNLFMSIAEQMGVTLENTAYSVNIKERLDFSCALFDPDGRLVANAPHIPIHLGSMGESVRTVLLENRGALKPGDVYVVNAPYNGGTHLPDVTVITPIFDEAGEEILFFVASRGHHADIGGRTPGSTPPDSRTVEEEGILFDNFKLVDAGVFLEDKLRAHLAAGRYPARQPDHNVADLKAQIAAGNRGVGEVRRMIEQFGLDVVHAYMRHVQDNAEEQVRRVIDVMADGEFAYPLDEGGTIRVKISFDKEKREATVDFTGTSPQRPTNFNAPSAVCRSAVLYVFRTLVDDNIPLNEGCLKPINIVIPKGCMLAPEYPAAVVAGNTETSQAVTDALFGALGVLAASQGTMNNVIFGNDTHQYYETVCGGSGAGPGFDGTSAVHTHMTNTRLTDPEVLEWRYPVMLDSFSVRHGSGGAGAYVGGSGCDRRIRFLEDMELVIVSNHRIVPPYGMAGGEPGQCGRNWIERADGTVTELSGRDGTHCRAPAMSSSCRPRPAAATDPRRSGPSRCRKPPSNGALAAGYRRRNVMALTLDEANRIAAGAIAHAASIDILVCVAVCDAGGRLVSFQRMDGAIWAAVYGCQGKAVASAAFGRPSGDLTERADHPTFRGIVAADGGHMILGRGGVPIMRDGQVIGACGVGGGTGEEDEECARAGVSRI